MEQQSNAYKTTSPEISIYAYMIDCWQEQTGERWKHTIKDAKRTQ
jgi:hypothetical protein